MTKAKSISVAALMLCGFIAAASAQNAPEPGQTPPAADESGQKPPPHPEPGTTLQEACITDDAGFTKNGSDFAFTYKVTNHCEERMQCKVYASVQNAKGSAQGSKILILAGVSKGAAATQSYALKVKMAGGMAQASRECKAI